ncbi:MAG: bifunctional 23S rRNA (guanine(2069)-N(7))-methyltransferase RlmK/23S rRNA (guanine(2445)-N(2))-methyltransferase RlmL [Spirochaetaceae bacterium]
MSGTLQLFVSCPLFNEALLASEIAAVSSAHDIREGNSGVYCSASPEDVYRVCLWSRLAGRVLLQLGSGSVANNDELYAIVASVAWEEQLDPDSTIAVAAAGSHPAFHHSNMPVLIAKDAIVDRMRDVFGRRPSVDVQNPDVRISVHLTTHGVSVALDLSGESLHRRGYRSDQVEAPLRENTAAAVLVRSGWAAAMRELHTGTHTGYPSVFADPMCGSGTLAIEAALMAIDRAPNLDRGRFGFMSWTGHDEVLWTGVQQEAHERARSGRERWVASGGRIWASDSDPTAIHAARRNAARVGSKRLGAEQAEKEPADRARVADLIVFEQAAFETLSRSSVLGPLKKRLRELDDAPLYLVTNPPYGVRLTPQNADSDADQLYAELGAWMSRSFAGFRATILAVDRDQTRHLGLKADHVYALYNGGLKIIAAVIGLSETNRYSPPGAASRGRRRDVNNLSDPSTGVPMIASRLRKNRKRLKTYLREHDVSCFRLYDADIPQHAAAVDVYTDVDGLVYAVVQEYAPPATVDDRAAEERFAELCVAVEEVLEIPASRVHTRTRRRQRGSDQYQPRRGVDSEVVVVVEDELFFEVNLTDYLDTGLFMDKRIARSRIGEQAQSRRFLNLFAYTCSVSVYAAAGGATETVSVDRSHTYLDWGARNFGLNGMEESRHCFVRMDAREYLRSDCGEFDLMYIDPPSFSNRTGDPHSFDVQRDHVELLKAAMAHLAEGGAAYFATNRRGFRISDEISQFAVVNDVSAETLPPDFKRSFRNHNLFRLQHLRAAPAVSS